MTIRMGIGRHQSWIWVTKHYQQDEGGFHPHTLWRSCNRSHIVTVVSVEKEHTQIWNLSLVCKEEIGLPPSPPEFQTWWYWFRRFLWLHMSLESLDSRKGDAVPFTGFSMSWNHSLKNNPFRTLFRPLLMDARTLSWGFYRVTTRPPKHSCRDC